MEKSVIKDRTPRLSTLKQRHAALEESINKEAQRPMPDFLLIQKLKRERLVLKEKIVSEERTHAQAQRLREDRHRA